MVDNQILSLKKLEEGQEVERLVILCYDVAKFKKECGCHLLTHWFGTKVGGRPADQDAFDFSEVVWSGQM